MPTRDLTAFITSILLLFACALPLSGCGGESPEKKEIRANWKRYYIAMQRGGGIDYHDAITEGTVAFYARMLPIAIKGTKAEIEALSAHEKHEIVMMRHRVPLAKLKTMDGRAYVVHACSEKFWTDPDVDLASLDEEKGPWDVCSIIVTGDKAVCEFPISIEVDDRESGTLASRRRSGGSRHGVRVEKGQFYMVKEDGAWRVDEVALHPGLSKDLNKWAAESSMPLEQYLIENETEESGKPVRADILTRPPR